MTKDKPDCDKNPTTCNQDPYSLWQCPNFDECMASTGEIITTPEPVTNNPLLQDKNIPEGTDGDR
jgi:hypothetical protein